MQARFKQFTAPNKPLRSYSTRYLPRHCRVSLASTTVFVSDSYAYLCSGRYTAHLELRRALRTPTLYSIDMSVSINIVSCIATNSTPNPFTDTPTSLRPPPLLSPPLLPRRRPHNRPHGRRLPQERVQGERDRCCPRRPAPAHRRPTIPSPLRRAAPGRRRLSLRLRQEPGLRRGSSRSGTQAVGHIRHRLGCECC